MEAIKDCVIEDGIKTLFFQKEKGKSYTLCSDSGFLCKIIDIDKCVFKNENSRRCDYLFLVPIKEQPGNVKFKESKAFFVELKGQNIREACEQIFNAIDRTKTEMLNFDIEARVVGTKGFQPEMRDNEYYRKVRKLIKKEISFCKVGKFNSYNYIEKI